MSKHRNVKTPWDLWTAIGAFVMALLILFGFAYCGKTAQAADTYLYSRLGMYGMWQGRNDICLNDSLNGVGDIEMGVRFESEANYFSVPTRNSFSIGYRHNSCIDKEDGENAYDLFGVGFGVDFKL